MKSQKLKPNATNDWRPRWQKILGLIRIVETEPALESMLAELANAPSSTVLAFVNAHAMNTLGTAQPFYEALAVADIILRDGSGMATLYKMLGQNPGLNLNGTDLIPRLIKAFDGRPIALLGTKEPYLEVAKATILRSLAPSSTVSSEHGFHPAQTYIDFARIHRPALIVLGMGMPKQEQVAVQLRSALDYPCLIVCGGAIIDFLGGKVSRAPALMRRTGTEWVYRLALEPRRLFQRYVVGNPLFLICSLKYVDCVKKTE